jgi:FkbM family methyltransferase
VKKVGSKKRVSAKDAHIKREEGVDYPTPKRPLFPAFKKVPTGAAKDTQKAAPRTVKEKKASRAKKASRGEGRASSASAAQQPTPATALQHPDLSAQVSELQAQIAALRAQLSTLDSRPSTQPQVSASSPATSYPPPATAAKPLPIYELKETRPAGYQSREIGDSTTEESQDGFFNGLFDRIRLEWLKGDFQRLASHDKAEIESHPQRAKLALLCACGHAQVGSREKSRNLLALAHEWGIDRRLALKTLVGGLHYSLGRAAYLSGNTSKALLHIEGASVSGFAGLVAAPHAEISAAQRIRALGFDSATALQSEKSPSCIAPSPSWDRKTSFTDAALRSENLDEVAKIYLATHHISEIASQIRADGTIQSEGLASAAVTLQHITSEIALPILETTNLDSHGRSFVFTHMKGDYIPSQIRKESKFYEMEFLEALGILHSKQGIVIDVGANIGNHSIYFAGVLGAEVIAIEPEPHNYFCLCLNAVANVRHDRIHCWNFACGKKEGQTDLEMKLDNNFGSFTSSLETNPQSTNAPSSRRIKAPLRSLDTIAGSLAQVSIIKIDVEGMELDVLEGAEHLISQCLPVIAVECFTNSLFIQISSRLRGHGYFPAQVVNWTPTFIFVSAKNPFHLQRLENLLRKNAITIASKNKNFVF